MYIVYIYIFSICRMIIIIGSDDSCFAVYEMFSINVIELFWTSLISARGILKIISQWSIDTFLESTGK